MMIMVSVLQNLVLYIQTVHLTYISGQFKEIQFLLGELTWHDGYLYMLCYVSDSDTLVSK